MSPWERLARGAQSLRRGIRGVLGADAYEKYLEFHAAHHPDHEPLSEAEFWRDRTDRQDRNPQGRCC
ncbi:YbdD/YjiX family protein [Arthrobacter woluwensis]|uniref:YbdD/YjiX family protein n=1 Tax=Arthrobacter woluwensis TaxID=156980 RepID=UPI003828B83B